MVWYHYGMAWYHYGMAWYHYGMAWYHYGMAWYHYGMVWYNMNKLLSVGMQLPEKYKENFDVSSEGPSGGSG